jgi:hypothetical protein
MFVVTMEGNLRGEVILVEEFEVVVIGLTFCLE